MYIYIYTYITLWLRSTAQERPICINTSKCINTFNTFQEIFSLIDFKRCIHVSLDRLHTYILHCDRGLDTFMHYTLHTFIHHTHSYIRMHAYISRNVCMNAMHFKRPKDRHQDSRWRCACNGSCLPCLPYLPCGSSKSLKPLHSILRGIQVRNASVGMEGGVMDGGYEGWRVLSARDATSEWEREIGRNRQREKKKGPQSQSQTHLNGERERERQIEREWEREKERKREREKVRKRER